MSTVKGVILAAGYGTRFLPATKVIPKEMFPLIDKPVLAFVIEEFIASGIHDILIVVNRRKDSIVRYFDRDLELEYLFQLENEETKLKLIRSYDELSLSFIYQKDMKGSGHALLQVIPQLAGSAALVAYPDDLHFGDVPLSKQLMDRYFETGNCICAGMSVEGDVSRYGVFSFENDGKTVLDLVEKPNLGSEPSHVISIGRYLFNPEYFEKLADEYKKFNTSGEFYHLEGLRPLLKEKKVEALIFSGERMDIGDPTGYLEATFKYAAKNPKYQEVLSKFAKEYLKQI